MKRWHSNILTGNEDHENILNGNESDPLTGNEDNASDLGVEVHQFPHLLPQGVV